MSNYGTAMADALGYIASALVLWTFSLNSMSALRIVAIGSNVMFIAYGAAAQLWPVLLLHAILLPLNSWRLWQLRRAPMRHAPAQAPTTSGAVVVLRRARRRSARRRTRMRGKPAGAAAAPIHHPAGGRPSRSSTVQATASNAAS